MCQREPHDERLGPARRAQTTRKGSFRRDRTQARRSRSSSPARRGHIFDMALAGKTAVIASIEQDFENRIHLAVTVDDDPGKDLGLTGKPGHRFFFGPDEVEII